MAPSAPLPPSNWNGRYVQLQAATGPSSYSGVDIIEGLGGPILYNMRQYRSWNGYLISLGGSPRDTWRVFPPPLGCTASSGVLFEVQDSAEYYGCRYATNGPPFSMSTGGCIGLDMSEGRKVCPDCTQYGVSFGLDANGTNWYVGKLTEEDMSVLDVANAVTGFGWLVRDGVSTVGYNPSAGNAARNAIGVRADGTLVQLIVDGCGSCPDEIGGSKGLTTYALAQEMLALGVLHAVNLDGGGSTTAVEDGEIINWPTDRHIPVTVPQQRDVTSIVCTMYPEGASADPSRTRNTFDKTTHVDRIKEVESDAGMWPFGAPFGAWYEQTPTYAWLHRNFPTAADTADGLVSDLRKKFLLNTPELWW